MFYAGSKVEMESFPYFMKKSLSFSSFPASTLASKISPSGRRSPTKRRQVEEKLSRSLDLLESRHEMRHKKTAKQATSSSMVQITESEIKGYEMTRQVDLEGLAKKKEFPLSGEHHDEKGAYSPRGVGCTDRSPKQIKSLTVQIPNPCFAGVVSSSGPYCPEGSFLMHDVSLHEPNMRTGASPVHISPATPQTPSHPSTPSSYGTKPMLIERFAAATPKEGQSSLDTTEYDFINESDFSSLRSSITNQSSVDEYLVVEGFPEMQSSTRTYMLGRSESGMFMLDSMSKMRLGLLKLLESVLFSLPADHVPAVIGEVLKAEYLLVWAFHETDAVRELAVKVRVTELLTPLFSSTLLLWVHQNC